VGNYADRYADLAAVVTGSADRPVQTAGEFGAPDTLAADTPSVPNKQGPVVSPTPMASLDILAPKPTGPVATHALAPCQACSPCGAAVLDSCAPARRERTWGDVELLLWVIKNGPLPPLVSTSPAASLGVPGAPGTTVIGPGHFDYGLLTGVRSSGGLWLNDAQTIGLESSGFYLQRGSDSFQVASDATGSPVLARPFFDTTINAPNSVLLALPGAFAGGLDAKSSTDLSSADLSIVGRLFGGQRLRADALIGFRYLKLEEDLQVVGTSSLLPGGVGSFAGVPVLPPATLTTFDHFDASNYFYGGQLGARATWDSGRLFACLTTKVALGTMQQIVDVGGSTSLTGPATATVPGGVLAVRSNSVHQLRDEFAVIPEVGFKLGYQLTDRLSLTVGYS
jgi:hypothetical protein